MEYEHMYSKNGTQPISSPGKPTYFTNLEDKADKASYGNDSPNPKHASNGWMDG